MVLSYTDIEKIADATMDDFNKFMFPAGRDLEGIMPHGTPIDQFASDYLKLKVTFEHLSSDGSFAGLQPTRIHLTRSKRTGLCGSFL